MALTSQINHSLHLYVLKKKFSGFISAPLGLTNSENALWIKSGRLKVWIYSTLQLLAEANNMLCDWIFELLSPRWCLVMRTPTMLSWKTSDLPLWLAWCDSTPSPTGLWAFVFGWSSMAAFGTVSVFERGVDGQRCTTSPILRTLVLSVLGDACPPDQIKYFIWWRWLSWLSSQIWSCIRW